MQKRQIPENGSALIEKKISHDLFRHETGVLLQKTKVHQSPKYVGDVWIRNCCRLDRIIMFNHNHKVCRLFFHFFHRKSHSTYNKLIPKRKKARKVAILKYG